jgi:hypothetical protein
MAAVAWWLRLDIWCPPILFQGLRGPTNLAAGVWDTGFGAALGIDWVMLMQQVQRGAAALF